MGLRARVVVLEGHERAHQSEQTRGKYRELKRRLNAERAVAVVEVVLRKDVCVARTLQGGRLLVHPVKIDGEKFLPIVYAYATTMRRAQGSTLELVGLRFERRRADRGYAYVGASRARARGDLYHLGSLRRTDWLPVGADPRGSEQLEPGAQSESSDSEPEPSTDESSAEEPDELSDQSEQETEEPLSQGEDLADSDTEGDGGDNPWSLRPERVAAEAGSADVAGLF